MNKSEAGNFVYNFKFVSPSNSSYVWISIWQGHIPVAATKKKKKEKISRALIAHGKSTNE